jgi:hypothetical protein
MMADAKVERVQHREENNLNSRYPYDLCTRTVNSYHGYKCVSCEVTENLRKDLVEFGNLQEIVCRQAVKDAIQVEINVSVIRLESLKDHENEVNWSRVTKGGRRPVLVNCQQEMPISNNRFQPLYNLNFD